MSVDPSQAIGTFPSGPTQRRRRRRQHHRSKYKPAVRRLQRILLLVLLAGGVIAISLYFAQRYSAYEPPPVISE